MANVFKQGNFQGFGQSASARTLQYTTQNTTQGSMLWCTVSTETTNATHCTLTVSDDVNGAWTQAGSVYGQQSNVRDISIWYKANSAGGVKPTVSVVPSQSVYMGLCIGEHTTTTTTVSVDHTSPTTTGQSTTNSQNPATGTVVVSQSGTLVIAACGSGDNNLSTITATSPFTMRESQINGQAFEQNSAATDESASANEACTFGFTGSHSVMHIIASFNVGVASNTYSDTGSGGILLGASSTILKTSTITANSGILLGSSSTVLKTSTITASGGILLGGSDTILKTSSIVASGGNICGGSSTVNRITSVSATGGILLGSSSTVNRITSIVASGGIVFQGSSTALDDLMISGSGGIILGGSSTVNRITSIVSIGGVLLQGTATALASILARGGIKCGGSAQWHDPHGYGGTLTIEPLYSGSVSIEPLYTESGGIEFSNLFSGAITLNM